MFAIGEIYIRRNLHMTFGGQEQGGISTPSRHAFIMLFTSNSGNQYGYHDGWTGDGLFFYSGEGQIGDMTFTRGNKAIRDHAVNNKALHLFKYVASGRVEYIGEMTCRGYRYENLPDANGNLRKTIIFELAPVL